MLFNSIDFAIFLPVVFFCYWLLNKRTHQNILLVLASYLFYGWWDWRFLSLILLSTIVDFLAGIYLGNKESEHGRKVILLISLSVNLALLGFFKYYNFFIDNFNDAFTFFGKEWQINSLEIVLPVGISFYTFQTMSYTIDVYRRRMQYQSDFITFTAYVSFFPQLVAGPIERASNLLPQFMFDRKFDYSQAVDGTRQILWGLFKKVVIADNCAEFVDRIFENSHQYPGSALVFGAIFFAFQIYGDFSGYSDIAIGTARLFGFDLVKNFAFPYFSRDIAEFWRRWHISLSTWFRDYLYIPLGGSRGSRWVKIRNTFIIFIVSGFWHGPNWTFVVWGVLNAFYFLPLLLVGKNRIHLDMASAGKVLPSLSDFLKMGITFVMTSFAWIFFRANDLEHAFSYISTIASPSILTFPGVIDYTNTSLRLITLLGLVAVFLIIEWSGREHSYAIANTFFNRHRIFRYLFYYAIIIAIFCFGGEEQEFIYFQF